MTCMYKGNKYRLVRSFTTNVKSIYGLENQSPNNKFMDNTVQFVHKTWGGVWVVIAISSVFGKTVQVSAGKMYSIYVNARQNLDKCYIFPLPGQSS